MATPLMTWPIRKEFSNKNQQAGFGDFHLQLDLPLPTPSKTSNYISGLCFVFLKRTFCCIFIHGILLEKLLFIFFLINFLLPEYFKPERSIYKSDYTFVLMTSTFARILNLECAEKSFLTNNSKGDTKEKKRINSIRVLFWLQGQASILPHTNIPPTHIHRHCVCVCCERIKAFVFNIHQRFSYFGHQKSSCLKK